MWRLGAGAVVVAGAAVAGIARGQAPAPFDWSAPAECDRASFASRLPPVVETPIHVHIAHDAATAGYRGTVRVGAGGDAELSRTVGASTCKELSSALGLVAAMLLGDARERAEAPRDAGDGAADVIARAPEPEAAYDGGVRRAPVDDAPEPGRSTWIALGAGAAAVSEAFAPEVRVGVHNVRARPGFGFGLGFDGALRGVDVAREGYDLALRWVVARPSLCALGVLSSSRFEVGLCGAAELGITWVQHIEGPLDAQTSERLWVGAGALGRARYVSGSLRDPFRFTLGLEASLMAVATRPTYRVEGGPSLLRTGPWSPNLAIFAGVQLP